MWPNLFDFSPLLLMCINEKVVDFTHQKMLSFSQNRIRLRDFSLSLVEITQCLEAETMHTFSTVSLQEIYCGYASRFLMCNATPQLTFGDGNFYV